MILIIITPRTRTYLRIITIAAMIITISILQTMTRGMLIKVVITLTILISKMDMPSTIIITQIIICFMRVGTKIIPVVL